MIKKLFHIADLHFRTFKRLDESEEVCKKFLDEVKKYIEENPNISKEVKEELIGKLGGSSEKEQLDKYGEFQKQIWEKENRQPTWKEALDFIREEDKKELLRLKK